MFIFLEFNYFHPAYVCDFHTLDPIYQRKIYKMFWQYIKLKAIDIKSQYLNIIKKEGDIVVLVNVLFYVSGCEDQNNSLYTLNIYIIFIC